MSHIVIKKKHLRYILYVSIIATTFLFRNGGGSSPEMGEDGVVMESNISKENSFDQQAKGGEFDNQVNSESSYSDVAINTNSSSYKGSRFSSDFNSQHRQNSVSQERTESHSVSQQSTSPSVAMQLYEDSKESSTSNNQSKGSQLAFTQHKSFASAGGAFGGGAAPLEEDPCPSCPPGDGGDPVQVPFDNEVYIVLFVGILIAFLSLRKKKLAV